MYLLGCVCETYSQVTAEICIHIYTYAGTHSVCVHGMCVFYIPPYFDEGFKREVLGRRDSFHVCYKAQRDVKIHLERFTDVSYQGELYFLKGNKNLIHRQLKLK